MRPEIRRNRENKAKKLQGKYLDALKTATENESMNRMINSDPSWWYAKPLQGVIQLLKVVK
jgi:uncharacterized protein (AIM24 family)